MSQSDYIRFIKTTEVLKNGELPPILDPSTYTSFETYNLETTVQNTKNSYSRLLPATNRSFFDIEKTVSTCPTFIMCTNTNQRPNRVRNTAVAYPYKPAPTYRLNKVYEPIKCKFNKGKVVRAATCSKKVCKCGTRIISAY